MNLLTDETIESIKRIHSEWIDLEVAGDTQGLIALCAEDIELRPPGGEPVVGRAAVLERLAGGSARIHKIEINSLCLTGSNQHMCLSANFETTYSLPGDALPRQVAGCHMWELRNGVDRWLVILVSWTVQGEA